MQITETELKELRDLVTDFRQEVRVGFVTTKAEIQALDQKLSSEIQALDQKLSSEIKVLDQKLSGEIKTLDQKVASLDQKVASLDDRLKTQDSKIWTVVTILLGAAVTLLIKILGFPTT